MLSPSYLAKVFLERGGIKSLYFMGTDRVKEFFEEREKLIDAIDRVPWELFEYKDELVEPIELNFMDKLSKLDDEYYDINEKFLEDLDRYLEGRLEHGNNSGSGENG